MALSNKSSVMAIKEESTEGVVVSPTAATDYVALQEGFSFEPSFQTLENKELKGSIGKAKTLLGQEQPKASFDHYLRASGVEGQAPNYRLLLKSALGLETVNSTEYPTVAASTINQIKVNTGIGANFKRGQALLIKDGTNGYSVRNVLSVSGDNLNTSFDLAVAPAAAVNLGKCIAYAPLNQGHPTLSVWEYRGNGGAVELMSGSRVTEASWDFQAGQFISGKFSLDGVEYFYNPMNVVSTTSKLDWLDNATTRVATIPQKIYKDPADLASAIQTAMQSQSANTITVTYISSTGKFKITSSGTTLSLLWNTGANKVNSIGALIGANMSADQTGALTYTLVNAINLASPYTPSLDVADPVVAKDNEVLMGDVSDFQKLHPSRVSVQLSNSRKQISDVTTLSGVSGSVLTGREVTISFTALLDQYDVDKFKRFRTGQQTSFSYSAGLKSGGNWQAGKTVNAYVPTATITSFKLGDDDGLAILECELKAFVDDSGNGEFYLNFL